jgi:hypothetical protein
MLLQLRSICSVLLVGLLLIPMNNIFAQNFETPRPSPNATVSQTVGITQVTIDYSSPGVKGRKIWGGLVPYNEVWRTGANEVTSITFDDPLRINGNELPAGTYGMHTIPGENEWEIIFSKDTEVDDGSQFDEKKEILRIKVTPKEGPFTERMSFTFTNTTDTYSEVNLIWEKLRVSFEIEANTEDLTLTKARDLPWVPTFQAATYCLQNNVSLEEGLNWIEASVLIKEVYWNTRIKAQLLEKLGKKSEAIASMQRAVKLGGEMENEPFDYERMTGLLAEWQSQ